MSKSITIRPAVPPELMENPENFSIAGHPNCVKLLSRLKIGGLLLNWTIPVHLRTNNETSKPLAILIPSIKISSGIMMLKLISSLSKDDAVTKLTDQVSQQLAELDLFINSLNSKQPSFQIQLLFVVIKQNEDQIVEEKVGQLKKHVLENSKNLKTIKIEPNHVFRKNEKENLEQSQGKFFRAILHRCVTTTNGNSDLAGNFIIDALIQSTPEFLYLNLSGSVFNSNNSEDNEGFNLQNVQKVKEVYLKFFKDSLSKIMFLPDLDSLGHQLLKTTCEGGSLPLKKADGFLGEYVNFTECILSRLPEPKGLLIRGYAKNHLDAVLSEVSPHNFEIDWILCGKNKIFGFEVGRTDNAHDPKKTIERKIDAVFSRMFPKLQYILASFLKSLGMTSEEIKEFNERHFGFVIYFPNISKNAIIDFFKDTNTEAKKSTRVLNSMPPSVLSQVFVLTNEEELFSSACPSLYHFVPNELLWSLTSAPMTTGDLFNCRKEDIFFDSSRLSDEPSGKSIAENRAVHEIQYLSGLLSFGFLIKKFSIDNYPPPTPSWEWKVKAERTTHSDLILSPQQERILEQNKRFLLLLGEPGCGKTSLLLARALNAAKDDSIEHIMFFIPQTKTRIISWLKKFVSESNCAALKRKWILQESWDVNWKAFSTKMLSKSIILVDELYLSSNQTFTESDKEIMEKTRFWEVLPLVKQCWLAKTEAGQDDKKHFSLATLPHFETETLNVLFRSSWHIGSFSSKLLHQVKHFSQSSAQTFGCTETNQYKIESYTFLDVNDLTMQLKTAVNFRKKFDSERAVIVFTTAARQHIWYWVLLGFKDILKQHFIVDENMNCYDVPFTGIEVASVLIIIDYAKTKPTEIEPFLSLIILASSRAQFELHITIKSVYTEDLKCVFEVCDYKIDDSVVAAARMGWPLELDKIFTKELSSKQTIRRGNELLAIALLREDEKLLQRIIKDFPAKDVDLRQIFITLGRPKASELLDSLKIYLGPRLSNIFRMHTKLPPFLQNAFGTTPLTDLLNFGTRFCVVTSLSMIEEIMGEKVFESQLEQSGLILFSACMNGQLYAIEWAVSTLEKYGMLKKQLNEIYDIWDGKKSTLLLFLCYMNMHDAKAIELLRKKGFDQNLLPFKLSGRNALETSVFYRNTKAVEELLKNPTWVRALLPNQCAVNQVLDLLENDSQDLELRNHIISRFNAVWENS